MSDDIVRGATFSDDGLYRWRLWRTFGPGTRVVFVGLNPSTADASVDDPTIRRCMGFARRWGHGRVDVVNLFAYRATHPEDLMAADAPVGDGNLDAVREAVRGAEAVVACWGHLGGFRDQDRVIGRILPAHTTCLGRTKAGHPRHPLYLRKDTEPQPFSLRPASS